MCRSPRWSSSRRDGRRRGDRRRFVQVRPGDVRGRPAPGMHLVREKRPTETSPNGRVNGLYTSGRPAFSPAFSSAMASSSPRSPLLTTRCSLPGRRLWFARAELYDDAIHLSGWTWRGRFERRIAISCIERVQWWAVLNDVNFMLHLSGGRTVPLQLHQGAGTWNCKLHDLMGESLLAQHELPGVRSGHGMAA